MLHDCKTSSMLRIVITTLLLSSCCVCGDQTNNEVGEKFVLPDPLHQLEIVNGTDADEGEFPFAVSLRYNNGHICGGTILNANFILTAAHCVCDSSGPLWYAPLITAQYGLTTIQASASQSIGVKSTTCHFYNPNAMYIFDVALLELTEPIPEEHLNQVVLEDRPCSTTYQLDAELIGWGRNETDGVAHTRLQKVEVVIYNDSVCSLAYTRQLNVYHHVCAGWPEDGRGSCQGDSGGPLLVDGKIQVGIVSFGASGNCGISNANYPKVLARISTYVEFIRSIAGDDILVASEYLQNDDDDDDDDGSGNDDDDDPPGNDDDDDPPGNDDDDDDEESGSDVLLPSFAITLIVVAVNLYK